MGVDFLAFFVPYVISKIWAKLPQKSKYMKYTDSQRHSTSSFTVDYTTDLELVRKKIGQNADARFRTFLLGNTDIEATLIFAIGSSDKELIEQQILKPLMMDFWIENSSESFRSGKSAIEFAKSRLLFVSELSSAKHLEGLLVDIWQGSTALFIEGSREVLVLGTGKGKSRSIGEPLAEPLVRGLRLG